MAQGRKPNPITIEAGPELNTEVVQAELQALDALAVGADQQQARVRAVAFRVGYQLPGDCIDPDLIQRDVAANMRRSVEACLEVGRGLAVLREACGHGQFLARLEVLGLERTVATRFILAASKFSNVATSQHLTKAIGTQSKLLEMLVLDDEQIDELALTGQTGELSLDDVSTMSVKELRAAVRELRNQKQAQQRLLDDKNKKLDELASRTGLNPWDEKVARFKAETSAHFDLLEEQVGQLYLMHGAILKDDVQWGDSDEAERIILRQFAVLYGDRLHRLTQQFAELAGHYEATLAGWAGELDGHTLGDLDDGPQLADEA